MAQPKPSAAHALYPHLASGERPERQQRAQSLSASMYPTQTPEAKAAQAQHQRRKAQFIADLRELTEQIRRSR